MTPILFLMLLCSSQDKFTDEQIYDGYIRNLTVARADLQTMIASRIESCKRDLEAIKASKAPEGSKTKLAKGKDKKKDSDSAPRGTLPGRSGIAGAIEGNVSYGHYVLDGKTYRFVPDSKESRELALDRKSKELKDLLLPRFDDWFLCDINVDRPKKGDVGALKYNYTIDQIINENSLLMSNGGGSYILRGISTHNLVDDTPISIPGFCIVEGPESYTTVLGAKRTVIALRVLSNEQAEKMVLRAGKEFPPPFQGRTWETADRKFSTEAEYVSHDKKTVTLRNREGKEITVEIIKLSRDDREWLRLVE